MENNDQQKTTRESILSTIKSGQLKMKPKWHFVLKAILVALGGIILALTALYLASFIIFALRQTGVLFVPVFGWSGWLAFFTHLPLFLIFLAIIFIAILELLVRHYAFAYRRPLVYSVFGIFVLVICGAMVLANSSFHRVLSKSVENNGESITGNFYREYSQQVFQDVHRGQIMQVNQKGFLISNQRKESLTIIITRRTRLPMGSDFYLGDIVVVFGDRDGDQVQAFGIQELEGE